MKFLLVISTDMHFVPSRWGIARFQNPEIGLEVYMRKEIVVLGRSSQKFCADVPMGPDTHISRKHASVYYSEKSGRFKMKVYGQNGIHVNDKLVPVGSSIDLDNKVSLDYSSIVERHLSQYVLRLLSGPETSLAYSKVALQQSETSTLRVSQAKVAFQS